MRLQGAVSTIAAEAVSKSFGEVEVLRQVTLRVPEKEVVCVIGPSGSGKTTLLRCLALLETPSAGRVTMNGETIASPKSDAAQKRAARAVRPDIGMVFQHFNLWPHMVIENVIEAPLRVKGMSRDAAVALAETLLDKVGLSKSGTCIPRDCRGGSSRGWQSLSACHVSEGYAV